MNASQDLFKQINNAVLDLQSSDLQSYPAPLKRLGKLLQHNDLQTYNTSLSENVQLGKFIAASERTQGSMVGSAQLNWPDGDIEILGLKLLLIIKFCDDPRYMADFGFTFYSAGRMKIMSGVHSVTSQIIIPFVRDYKAYVESQGNIIPRLVLPMSNKVFIVHGHDGEVRESVARFLTTIGFVPVILNEQANRGRTIIEKVEANADVGFAVVLLTPDDLGRAKGETDLEPRARQNVLLELGYFMALLGRDKVCALRRGNVSVPSDFAGVVWEAMDDAGGWKPKLARELQAAGHSVDVSRILG